MHKTHTQIIAALTALLIPCTAFAAVTLDATDSVAGIGLTVNMHGANAGDSVNIQVTDPDGQAVNIPVQADTKGDAVAMMPGDKTQTAGTYTVIAEQKGAVTGSPVQIQVHPDSVDNAMSQITVQTSHIAADGKDQATVDVTLRDKYGNTLSGRPVSLIASRKTDIVSPLSPSTDETGTQEFAVRTTQNGTIQLRAIDLLSAATLDATASINAGSTAVGGNDAFVASTVPMDSGKKFYFNAQLTQTSDVIDHFNITAPTQMAAGDSVTYTVTAVDKAGNTVQNYNGTVVFTTTDPQGIVPDPYTFQSRDQGQKTFPLALTFQTGGPQTLRIQDQNDQSISGEVNVTVGGGANGSTGSISITSYKDGDYVNTLNIVITGMGPRLANLIVMGGAADARGTTDDNGAFSIPITLNAGQRDFTVRVRDDAGRSDSGPIHLILDQDPPAIAGVTFAPDQIQEGDKVLVAVQSEPHLKQVSMSIPDRVNNKPTEVDLTENPTESGSYQGFFTAPPSDTYQAAVSATDAAGNTSQMAAQFTVGTKTLPKVANLKAIPTVDAIDLTWDPVAGDVSGYRIYIGDSSNNYLYTLDTGKVTTKATVKGLTQGQQYTFAITALRGDLESAEKSDPVQARVLGFKLEVTPGDGELQIDWTSLASDLPLSSFILEYGTSKDALSETRTLNGELRTTTIHDLLNGVDYFVRITPVTITGDKLDELAANGDGTPNGTGFKPGARDDVPFNVQNLPQGPLHSGAPSNPSSGVPNIAWVAFAAIAAGIVLMRLRRRRSVAQTEAFLQAINSHYRI